MTAIDTSGIAANVPLALGILDPSRFGSGGQTTSGQSSDVEIIRTTDRTVGSVATASSQSTAVEVTTGVGSGGGRNFSAAANSVGTVTLSAVTPSGAASQAIASENTVTGSDTGSEGRETARFVARSSSGTATSSATTVSGAAGQAVSVEQAGVEFNEVEIARRVASRDLVTSSPRVVGLPFSESTTDAPANVSNQVPPAAGNVIPPGGNAVGVQGEFPQITAAAPTTPPVIQTGDPRAAQVSVVSDLGSRSVQAPRPDLDVRLLEQTPIIAIGLIALNQQNVRFLTDPNAIEAATQVLEPRTINDGESARSSENRSTLQEFGNPALTTQPTRTTPSADAIVVFRTIADISTVASDASVNLVA